MGTQVVVPYREEDDKRHLKPMGDLGQIVPMVRLIVIPRANKLQAELHRNGTSGTSSR